jgi:proteasome component ECM29
LYTIRCIPCVGSPIIILFTVSASAILGDNSFTGSAASTAEMQIALRPHLGKLLPRILRARHDPNKQTREQITSLWNGLTGGGSDAREVISQHLLSTVDTLLEDATSKLWRARVGACGALTEIIVGREWQELGDGGPILTDDDLHGGATVGAGIRLLRMWRVATRSLDDVRSTVRESGDSFARGVRALTIRLCDPTVLEKSSGAKRAREEQSMREREASAAAATSLRWLCGHGLNQACAEATGICVSALVEISKSLCFVF